MKKLNKLSFVILILEILKFRNIDRSSFGSSKCWPLPKILDKGKVD